MLYLAQAPHHDWEAVVASLTHELEPFASVHARDGIGQVFCRCNETLHDALETLHAFMLLDTFLPQMPLGSYLDEEADNIGQ